MNPPLKRSFAVFACQRGALVPHLACVDDQDRQSTKREQTNVNDHFEKWNTFAPLGLLLIGLGVSLVGHANSRKAAGKGWFVLGTLGLIVLNAGVAIFGESVKARALYEWELRHHPAQDTTSA